MARFFKIYRYLLSPDTLDSRCICLMAKIKDEENIWKPGAVIFRFTEKKVSRNYLIKNVLASALLKPVTQVSSEDISKITTGEQILATTISPDSLKEIEDSAQEILLEEEDVNEIKNCLPVFENVIMELLPSRA